VAVLIVDPYRSKCGECNRGADPYAESHEYILEYSDDNGKAGCGAVWTHISSNYADLEGLHESVRKMRPDLEWKGGFKF
jgi:hypothetical protein